MQQIARNLTMEEWGVLTPGHSLIYDGDKKCCASCKQMLDDVGITRVPLPPRSPWLHACAERWVQSVQNKALSPMILCGERSLRHVLSEYVAHYHGPAGAFKQEPTVLNKPLCGKYLSDGK